MKQYAEFYSISTANRFCDLICSTIVKEFIKDKDNISIDISASLFDKRIVTLGVIKKLKKVNISLPKINFAIRRVLEKASVENMIFKDIKIDEIYIDNRIQIIDVSEEELNQTRLLNRPMIFKSSSGPDKLTADSVCTHIGENLEQYFGYNSDMIVFFKAFKLSLSLSEQNGCYTIDDLYMAQNNVEEDENELELINSVFTVINNSIQQLINRSYSIKPLEFKNFHYSSCRMHNNLSFGVTGCSRRNFNSYQFLSNFEGNYAGYDLLNPVVKYTYVVNEIANHLMRKTKKEVFVTTMYEPYKDEPVDIQAYVVDEFGTKIELDLTNDNKIKEIYKNIDIRDLHQSMDCWEVY